MGVELFRKGSRRPTSVSAARRTFAPIAIVIAAALLFTLLLLLVRLQWAPLESADHDTAARLNALIAGHSVVVAIVKAVTWLGSTGVLWTLIRAATVLLAIRRRWRLTVPGFSLVLLDAWRGQFARPG
jgi:undecaprenyl-diphosphatase